MLIRIKKTRAFRKTFLIIAMVTCFVTIAQAEILSPQNIRLLEIYSSGWAVRLPLNEEVAYERVEISPPYEPHFALLNSILEKLEKKAAPENPKFWYYKYQAYLALGYIRTYQLGGSRFYRKDKTLSQYHEKMTETVVKTIELDDERNPQISADDYALMLPRLPDDLKLIVIPRMLKSPVIGEGEDIRWQVYGEYVGTLKRLGRYDDAVKVLEQMKKDPYVTGFSQAEIQDQINQTLIEKEKAGHETAAQNPAK